MCAWIESHQTLRNHRKTLRMARILSADKVLVIGALHCLWWWAVDYAEDGELTGYDAVEIAEGAGWEGDPSFEDEAFPAIYHHTGGIPRRINILCSRVLLSGYLDDTHCIAEGMVKDVAGELRSDLAAGRQISAKQSAESGHLDERVDGRLLSIERTLARHERVIKRTLELTIRLVQE